MLDAGDAVMRDVVPLAMEFMIKLERQTQKEVLERSCCRSLMRAQNV